MPTPRRWEDPALKPSQERDAAQTAYKRYLDGRDRRQFDSRFNLLYFLRDRKWRRQWEHEQRQASTQPQKARWWQRRSRSNGP